MSGSARYSEADRRGRNSNQDVTNIGVAGRRTGLRVEGTRRDSDGFENESAFFSPTTTAKKANPVMDISSAKSIRSATKGSGSYDDMDLEASSAQDVVTTLRRRSEGPTSAARRSRSPTKTHLNSPALRVRSTSRHPASPSKSVLKSPSRPAVIGPVAKVARKLDFTRADPTAESDEEVSDHQSDTHRETSTERSKTKPYASTKATKSAHARTAQTEDLIEDLQAAEVQEDHQADAGSEYAGNVSVDQDDDVAYNAIANNEADDFDEYLHDQPGEKEVSGSPPRTDSKSTRQARKDSVEADESVGRSSQADSDPVPDEPAFSDIEDEEEEMPQRGRKTKARASPSADEDGEDDTERQPPRKKPAGKSRQTGHDKVSARANKKTKVSSRPSFSPSRATRERSVRTASPQREWRETVDLSVQANGDNEDGVRKSSRFKIAPLAFWRGEKMVYGRGSRRKSMGGTIGLALPEVKEIIHVDLVEGEQKRRRTRPGSVKARPRKNRRNENVKDESESESEDEDDGWEETITVEAPVRSFDNQHELVKKVLAIPESDYEPREVVGQGIFFQKTLSEEPHFAAGVLDIPVGERKPPKPSKQNTMFFFIFRGYVEVKIHEAVFRLRKGAQFTVPRGNFYEIINVGQKDARLFFSQSTDTLANHLIAHPELLVRPKELEE